MRKTELLDTLLVGVFAGLLSYGMFTFILLTPNPGDWTEEVRALLLLVWVIISGGLWMMRKK